MTMSLQVGMNEAQLEVVSNITVLPKRRWWIPPTLLLPKEIVLKGNICIKGERWLDTQSYSVLAWLTFSQRLQ